MQYDRIAIYVRGLDGMEKSLKKEKGLMNNGYDINRIKAAVFLESEQSSGRIWGKKAYQGGGISPGGEKCISAA